MMDDALRNLGRNVNLAIGDRLDGVDQLADGSRLHHVAVRPAFQDLDRIVDVFVDSEQQDLHARKAAQQGLDGGGGVEIGHAVIEDEQRSEERRGGTEWGWRGVSWPSEAE